ncbi:MAG: 50S ribosomal protein L37ae [Candidatus Bathyarchaeia archaeon]
MGRKRRTKKIGPSGGLGVKYGVTVRKRYSEIVSGLREKHVCPQCGLKAVRRESVGIWTCRKCGFRFAGGAYIPSTKLGVSAERSTRGT